MVPAAEGQAEAMKEGWTHNKSLLREESFSLSGYEHNKLFQNTGSSPFFEVADVLGADSDLDSRGAAVGDLDRDGDLDLVISNRNFPHITILRNDAAPSNHFLAVALEGMQSNSQGIGARLELSCSGQKQVRSINLGDGFMSQSTTDAWFGLKQCEHVEQLDIQWPSGLKQTLSHLSVDQKIRVTEGQNGWEKLPLRSRNPDLSIPPPVVKNFKEGQKEIRQAAPQWILPDPDGNGVIFPGESSKTVLVNFWATWCVPCRKEIKDLSENYQKLKNQGIELIGISLDDFEGGTLKRFIENRKIPYPIVQDRKGQVFQEHLKVLELGQTGIPFSLLIQDGMIKKIYAGSLNVEELLTDDLKS